MISCVPVFPYYKIVFVLRFGRNYVDANFLPFLITSLAFVVSPPITALASFSIWSRIFQRKLKLFLLTLFLKS